MNYKLIAVSDSDPAWNHEMEQWWNNGGALLWNLCGGVGTDSLILTHEEVESFLERAKQIDGWDASGGPAQLAGQPANPVTILPYVEEDATESDQVQEVVAAPPALCCPDCGRPVHPALHSTWNRQEISVPRSRLNHLLNSLQEAIEFSRGKGPNNYRTWEDALVELGGALESQEPHSNRPTD